MKNTFKRYGHFFLVLLAGLALATCDLTTPNGDPQNQQASFAFRLSAFDATGPGAGGTQTQAMAMRASTGTSGPLSGPVTIEGELLVVPETAGQQTEVYTISLEIDPSTIQVVTIYDLGLPGGAYDFYFLLKSDLTRFGGSVQNRAIVGGGTNTVTFRLSPIVGLNVSSVTELAGLSPLLVPYNPDTIATYANPRIGITVGDNPERFYAINIDPDMPAIELLLPSNDFEVKVCFYDGAVIKECNIEDPPPPVPNPPNNVSVTVGDGALDVTWSQVAGATSYNLYHATTSGQGTAGTKVELSNATSHTLAGLTNGVPVYLVVTAVNEGGESQPSYEVVASPLEAATEAPSGVTATGGNAQVVLSWAAVARAVSYNVYRSTPTAAGMSGTKIDAGAATTITDTGLSNGTMYHYVVTAVNGSEVESAASGPASAMPQMPPPGAPTGVGLEAGDGAVTVSWSAVATAASYNLYWSTTAGAGTGGTRITGANSPYLLAGLTNNITVYVVVTAVNAGGEGSPSAEFSATPLPPPPGAPTGVQAVAGDAQVTVSWNALSKVNQYNVYRSTSSGTGTAGTKLDATGTSLLDTGLTNGVRYYYVVTAVSSGRESQPSLEVSAKPQVPPPGVPTGVSAAAGDASIAVSWSSAVGVSSYNVYYSTGSNPRASGTRISNASSPHTLEGLANGTTYYLAITAQNAGGESAASAVVNATPVQPPPPPPAAPQGISASPDDQLITVSWTAVTGATSYNLYWSTTSGDGVNGTQVQGAVSPYKIISLANGTPVYAVVTALNEGGEGEPSAEVSATPVAPPPAPEVPPVPLTAIVNYHFEPATASLQSRATFAFNVPAHVLYVVGGPGKGNFSIQNVRSVVAVVGPENDLTEQLLSMSPLPDEEGHVKYFAGQLVIDGFVPGKTTWQVQLADTRSNELVSYCAYTGDTANTSEPNLASFECELQLLLRAAQEEYPVAALDLSVADSFGMVVGAVVMVDGETAGITSGGVAHQAGHVTFYFNGATHSLQVVDEILDPFGSGSIVKRESQILNLVLVQKTTTPLQVTLPAYPLAAPKVTGVSPQDDADDVAIDTSIAITFTHPMVQDVTLDSIYISPSTSGKFSWSSDDTVLTLRPTYDLAYDTVYTVTISTGALDSYGNGLEADKIISFKTGEEPDRTSPSLLEITPEHNSTEVDVATSIVLRFSEAVDTGTAEDAFSLDPEAPGEIRWSGLGGSSVMTFHPTNGLVHSTTYALEVETTLTDLAGNPLDRVYGSQFTTGVRPDETPPYLAASSPANEAAEVALDATIVVEFSESMDPGTVEAAFGIQPSLSGNFGWVEDSASTVMTYAPTEPMQPDTQYRVTIGTAAVDLSGNEMEAQGQFTFRTLLPPRSNTVIQLQASRTFRPSRFHDGSVEILEPLTVLVPSMEDLRIVQDEDGKPLGDPDRFLLMLRLGEVRCMYLAGTWDRHTSGGAEQVFEQVFQSPVCNKEGIRSGSEVQLEPGDRRHGDDDRDRDRDRDRDDDRDRDRDRDRGNDRHSSPQSWQTHDGDRGDHGDRGDRGDRGHDGDHGDRGDNRHNHNDAEITARVITGNPYFTETRVEVTIEVVEE